MGNPVEMLTRYVREFDLDALGAALGPEMAGDLLDRRGTTVPVSAVTMTRDQLGDLLGQAAQRGVARFLAAAELRAAVEGDTGDESYAALTATVESVRAATTLICTDPDALSQAERAEMAAKGMHILLQLVHSWDAAKRGCVSDD